MKYALILVAAMTLAPTSVLAATNGTVRMDWFDDVTIDNMGGDTYTFDGQPMTGAGGFILFDIDKNEILDAEFNIFTGGTTIARAFDVTEFSFQNTPTGITFNPLDALRSKREFTDPAGNPHGYYIGFSTSLIDFTQESGRFLINEIHYAGYSREFVLRDDNPTLIFTPAVVPEPSTALLLGLASMGFFGTRRRRS